MITGTYRADGSLESLEVDYYGMPPQARRDVERWVRAHDIDPGRVPVDAVIGFDPATDEWRFPVWVRAERGIRIDPGTGDPVIRIVRRRRRTADIRIPRAVPLRRGIVAATPAGRLVFV